MLNFIICKIMKKRQLKEEPWCWNTWRKKLIIPKMLLLLLCTAGMLASAKGYAQKKTKVTLDLKNVTLNRMFEEMKKQTDYDFFYNSDLLKSRGFVTVKADNEEVSAVLDRVLPGVRLEYQIAQSLVTIRAKKEEPKAASNLIQVSGKVTDENANPLPGATVFVQGTTVGVTTDMNGRYTLTILPDGVLRVTFIGYKDEQVLVKGRTTINVQMKPTSENLEEATVVAFGTQKKESMVGSIQTVRPMDLKSSSSDLTISFTGKIAGIIGWQTGGGAGCLDRRGDEHQILHPRSQFFQRSVRTFGVDRRGGIFPFGPGAYGSGRHRILQCAERRFRNSHVRCARGERRHPGDHQERRGGKCLHLRALRGSGIHADG